MRPVYVYYVHQKIGKWVKLDSNISSIIYKYGHMVLSITTYSLKEVQKQNHGYNSSFYRQNT